MSEVVVTRLPELAERANEAHRDVQGNHRRTWTSARGAGEALLEAKAVLEHGEWLPWLGANFEGSARTAQRYLQISESWDQLQSGGAGELLTIKGALKAVSRPRKNGTRKVVGKPKESAVEESPAEEATSAPFSCVECHRLRSELETERAWSKRVLESLGVSRRTEVAERIAQLRRGSLKVANPVTIKPTESIQEYEQRKRKAEAEARPSAMY